MSQTPALLKEPGEAVVAGIEMLRWQRQRIEQLEAEVSRLTEQLWAFQRASLLRQKFDEESA